MATILAGTETQVNTHTNGHQLNQQVTALEGGGWVVVWESDDQDGDGVGVYSQVYTASGATLGGEMQVNSFTTDGQSDPQVAALPGGGWVVTWESDHQDGDDDGVYSQVYSALGVAVGGEIQVNSHTSDDQSRQRIAALADGGWVVTWESYGQDGDDFGVYSQAYDASGSTLGGETQVNSHTADYQFGPQVAALEDGGWVVMWSSIDQDGDDYGVYLQRYNAGGFVVGGETLVNAVTAGAQYGPSITALEGGGWVAAWMSDGQDGDGDGIYLQAYDALGAELRPEIEVNSFTAGNQEFPQVAALAGGGWVVVWTSEDQDGSAFGVYSQAFDADGDRIGTETRVNTHAANSQFEPQVAALADGGWVVTWTSDGQDGEGGGVYSQVYGADGLAVGGETLVNTFTTKNQALSQVAALEDGGWVVTWTSGGAHDGDGGGVYQKVFRFNQSPTITSDDGGAGAVVSVAENGLVVTTVASTDPEDDVLAYSLSGGADAARFEIDAATGVLSFKTAPDREAPGDAGGNNVYDVVVRVSDGDLADTQALAVTVANVNEAPAIGSSGGGATAAVSVAENGLAVTTVVSTDPENQTLSYSISGGADAAKFEIDAATGILSFKAAPDFEAPGDAGTDNTYDVVVRAGDGSLSDTQAIAVMVTGVDEAPAITSNGGGASAAVIIAENGIAVTTVTSTDPENQARTYSISGGADAAKFEIDAATGALSFKAAPDRETPADAGGNNVYDVTVRAAAGGLSDTQAIAVTVTNLNEAPGGIALSDDRVKENKEAGRVVGTLSADDPEGSPLTYALTSNPGGLFEIVGDELRTAAKLDFEKNDSHVVEIEAADPGGLTVTRSFTIDVRDVVDLIEGDGKDNKLKGASGADEISGLGGSDKLLGKGGDDVIDGGKGKDRLEGDGDADRLDGGKGNDRLDGGSSEDRLSGGKGEDRLEGGKSADKLSGGKGADSFVFKSIKDSTVKKDGRDVIADFKRGQDDQIDLSAIDARTGSKKDHAFDFIGKKKFSGDKGDLRYETKKGKTFVYGDVNGDKKADFAIELSKATDLKKADFVL